MSWIFPYEMELDMIQNRRLALEVEIEKLEEEYDIDKNKQLINNLHTFDNHLEERISAIEQRISELHDWYRSR